MNAATAVLACMFMTETGSTLANTAPRCGSCLLQHNHHVSRLKPRVIQTP